MKKHYKLTPIECDRHDMAVKIRKMTDEQLVKFINDTQRDAEYSGKMQGVEEFLSQLFCMSGTGNGIGAATVAKLREFAIDEGFILPF